jgi:hypothetical protein
MAKLAPHFGAGLFSWRLVARRYGFRAKLSPVGAIVTEHKFKIGRLVLFNPKAKGRLDAARGTYHIIRRMPPAEGW